MNVITVAKGFFSRYSTITKALKDAVDGDKIIIKPGIYEENLVLDKSVELCASEKQVVIQSQKNDTVLVTAEHAVMRGLTIRQYGTMQDPYAVTIEAGNSLFEDCHISCQFGHGILLCNADTNPVFKACTISDNGGCGICVTVDGQGYFEKCKIFGSKQSNVHIHDEANPIFIDCDIYNSPMNGVYVYKGGRGQFEDCRIYHNEYPNIATNRDGNPTFKNCKISEGKNAAVYIHNGGLGKFLSCDFYASGKEDRATIEILTKGNPYFEKCNISDSQSIGIRCKEDGEGRFVSCEIAGSIGPNIVVSTGANPLFESCRIHGGQKNGVWVKSDGFGKFIACEIYENALPNIGVNLNGNPQFEQCQIYRGKGIGVLVKEDGIGSFKNCRSFGNQDRNFQIDSKQTVIENCLETEPATIDQVLLELDDLIGLEEVKKQIRKTIQFIEFNKEISQYGVNAQDVKLAITHTVLSGNPGTGKTTVARLLGKLYSAMGLLPSGHVIAVNREKLVGQYIGQTAPKTKECIEQAVGGILFIDEAYELSNKGSKDFGPEAIAVILEEMENRRGEFMVVIAGYEEEIQQFLESNPGLKSRFNQSFKLEDYTPEEMKQIAVKIYKEKERVVLPNGLELLLQEFTRLWRKRDKFFANARTVRNLVEKSLQQQAERCMGTPRQQWNPTFLTTVTEEDIQMVLPKKKEQSFVLDIQEEALEKAVSQLDQLVSLQNVKNEIHKLITLVRYYREEGKDILTLSPHTVLKGSPGTGKTEVARIIARIYEALGILERGDLVEVNRDKLVRAYAGESEKVTAQYIEKAMGGVLFIDEAYQLTQYGADDPGHKVVEVLLKYMEDRRGEFIVIVAGYSMQMDQFLNSNDGLQRRFARQIEFEDYMPEELMQISEVLLQKNGYTLSETARKTLFEYFTAAYLQRDRSFGNAGFVRNVIMETIKNVDYRVALLPKEKRNSELIRTVLCEDIARQL